MLDSASLKEFKQICRELVHGLSDEEALKAAQRVTRFLQATEPETIRIFVTEQERRAFEFIQNSAVPPSIRAITKAVGMSSSRSGYRIVQSLMAKGIAMRDEAGKLRAIHTG